ncbi:Respiratory burst oxidase [Klebsormidium nitens]|uniref:Respiratory burst oxidase n=1 Tax=Klebsormidium nitens TaxID=105231 RepID=A0A1Y1HT52_KLENI|nr:Respiratory burst oxidase [Klebsormidium nitens]|eukprot:GAQ81800.1 Respiratory burst oxidase [Klebsormidium nitens]
MNFARIVVASGTCRGVSSGPQSVFECTARIPKHCQKQVTRTFRAHSQKTWTPPAAQSLMLQYFQRAPAQNNRNTRDYTSMTTSSAADVSVFADGAVSSPTLDRVELLRAEMRRVLQVLPAITAALGPNPPPKLTQFAASKQLKLQLPNNQLVDKYRESEVGIFPHLRNQIETVEKILSTPDHSADARRVASFSGGTPGWDGAGGEEKQRFASMSGFAYPVRSPTIPAETDEASPISDVTRILKKDSRSIEVVPSRRGFAEGGLGSSPGGSQQAVDEGGETEASTKLRGGWAQLAVFLTNRRQQVVVLLLWLAANCALFVYKYLAYMDEPEYKITGPCICVAKGAAEAIKLNMALILLPVSRFSSTVLRDRFGRFFPFDYAIMFHQFLAFAILVFTLLHVALHLTCDYPRMAAANHQVFLDLLGDQFDGKQPNYWGFLGTRTAVLGFITLGLMFISFPLALPMLRKASSLQSSFLRHLTGFNAFWYSHMLLLLMFPLLIFHGSRRPIGHYPTTSTWLWIVAPMVIYAVDRVIRVPRARCKTKQVDCTKAEMFPGGVLGLTMTKPPGFNYRAGQYLFLQCPQVSAFEWHPYSITSAPSDDFLRVHIRAVGDWTNRLHQIFAEAIEKEPFAGKEASAGKESDLEAGTPSPTAYPRLLIDGPFGAPAQDFHKFKVVMLIGAGIGLTPFASVMRECHHQMERNARQALISPSSTEKTVRTQTPPGPSDDNQRSARLARVEKVYLYWATKDRAGLTWFRRHLSDFLGRTGVSPAQSMVELNSYLTQQGKVDETRITPAGSMESTIQEVHDDDVDVQMGTNLGRPDWDKVFARARRRHPNTRIGVFFCGPRTLSNKLCQLCCKYTGESTHFEYFKENF